MKYEQRVLAPEHVDDLRERSTEDYIELPFL